MNKPTRILIVEDLLADVELAQYEIQKLVRDCEFQVVETRQDFLDALETFQPDLILSDYHLPSFDGMIALKLALEHAPLIPLIIWTGSISEDVAVDCMKAGATNYVLKENIKRLGPAVIHALDERQLLLERKQAEEALRNNEKRFRALIENGLDDISLLAADGTLLWESPSTIRNLGYAEGEFLGSNIFELIHPDDENWTREVYTQLIQEPGGRQSGVFRLRRADGTWRWVEAIVTNMLNEPSVNAMVVNYRDITERKQAEEELRESQAKYRNLVETSHDLIWSVDAEGRFTFVNRAAKGIYGYEPEELLGRSSFDIMDPQHYHEEDLKKFKERVAYVNEFKEVESYVRHRDGRQIILSANAIVLRDAEGKVTGVTGSSHDITIRKRVEEALKEERNLLRTLIDNLPDRIYVMDTQGRKVLSNTADWKASGGKTMEDVIGKTDFDTYPPELAEEFWTLDKAVLDSGLPVINQEEPGLDFDGNPVSILSTKVPLRDNEGKVTGLVGIGRDITERKQAEEKLGLSDQILQRVNALVLVADSQGSIAYVSPSAKVILGYEPEELLGDQWWELSRSETSAAQREKEYVGRAARGEVPIASEAYERAIKDRWGHTRWISWVDAAGPNGLLIGVGHDITQRKKAEIERQALLEIMQGLANIKDLQELLKLVHDSIAKVIYAENFFVVFYNKETGLFEEIYSVDQYDPPMPPAKLEKSITSYIFRSGEPLLLTQAVFDELAAKGEVELVGTNSQSWLGAPLKTPNGTVGVIVVQDYETLNRYSERDKDFLMSIAAQVALAIERKQAEEALRESEEKYRLLFEGNPLPMWIYDLETLMFLKVNEAAVRHYGYSIDEFMSMSIKDIRPSEEIPRLLENVSHVAEGIDEAGVWHHCKKDGTLIQVEIISHTVQFTGRRAELVLANDVTERKQAEEALRESENKARALLNALPDLMFRLNREGTFLDYKADAADLYAQTEPTLIGKKNRDVSPPEFADLINQYIHQTLESGDMQIFEYQLPIPERGQRAYEARMVASGKDEVTAVVRDITERKQAEEALREAEIKYRTLVEQLPAVTYLDVMDDSIKSGEFNTSYVSPQVESLLGYSPDVFYSDPSLWTRLIHPDDRERVLARIAEHYQSHRFFIDEYRMMTRKGSEIWVRDEAIVVRSESDKQLFSQGVVFDITERMRAETALIESNAQFRTLFEASPDAIILIDQRDDWPILDCNTAACQMNGYTREELVGQPIDILNVEPSTSEGRAAYIEQIRKAGVFHQESAHRRKDGTIFQVDIATTLITLGGREVVLGIDRDITERKRAEQALMESMAQFRTLFEASPDALMLVDPRDDWPILDCNTAACQMNGYSREEMLGQSINILNLTPGHPSERADYLERIHQAGVLRLETFHRRKDGSIFPVEVSTSMITLGGRDVILGIDRDITERRQAETALRESETRYHDLFENSPVPLWEEDFSRVKQRLDALHEEGVTDPRKYLIAHPEVVAECAGLVRVIDVNQSAMELYHAQDKADLVKNMTEIPSGNFLDHFQDELLSFLDGKNQFKWEGSDSTLDGQSIEVIVEGSIPQGHEDDWSKVIVSVSDITKRKQMELELRASEERFLQLAANIQEVFWMTDAESGKEIYMSPAAETIWGRPIAELLQEPNAFIKSILPEDLPMVLAMMEKEKQGVKVEMEYRILRPNKSVRWIWDRAFPIFDESGKVTRIAGISADITERKQGEDKLRESETRFAGIVNSALDAIISVDSEQRILLFNPAAERIFQCKAEEAIGQSLGRFIPDEKRTTHQRHVSDFGETGFTSRIMGQLGNLSGRRADGEEFPIEASISHIEAAGQHLYTVVLRDITERKQAEEALRASEEKIQNIIRHSGSMFYAHTPSHELTYVSPQAHDILDCEPEEAMRHWQDWLSDHPMNIQGIESTERAIQTGQRQSPYELELITRQGRRIWVQVDESPMVHNGKTVAIVGSLTDITERKRAEEEIRRRAEETSALLETSLALTNLDLNAALQTIGNSAKTLFAADGCRIFLMEPDGETLRCVLALQENNEAFSDLRLKVGEGVTGAVAASGRAEIVNEMQNDPRAVQVPGTQEKEAEAIMFAPLKERDHAIGVISIRRGGAERTFQPADLELLEAFASMAASAVSNARLYDETQRRLAELEALYENGLAVGRLLQPREIGDRIINTFARYLPWHHVTIRLKREDSDELELAAFNLPDLKDEDKAEVEQRYSSLNTVGQGMSGWVIQTGKPIRTGNVQAHPQYVDMHGGIQSGLYMPLRIGERVIGVISVESEDADAFTEQDERLLATLANQAAVAFENARLYQAAQQELAERKRAENALRTSETHYRELADSITDIFFELDQDLRYTHWNRASELLIGAKANDVIGKSMQDVFGATDEQTRIEKIYETVLTTHQPRTFETTLLLDGQQRAFEINAYPSMRGVSVVAKDVTARKRTEIIMQKRFELMEYSAHHTLNEVMQRTVDEVSELTGSTIGFFHFLQADQNNLGMQTWSTNTIRLFNVPISEGTHLPLDQGGVWAQAAHQRRSLIQNDYKALSQKKGLPQGHVPILREMVIPIIRNEKIVAIMGIGNKPQDYTQQDLEVAERLADYAWDITERKQMESALAEERNQLAQRVDERTADLIRANSNLARALRVKDEFLANMSHELRTPLNAILGLSESLAEQIAGPLNEKQQKYITTISESGHHLLSLINDILDLAKIEAGQITLDINKVDIQSVCQASLRMIKQLAQKKNQEVIFQIDDGFGLMYADERRLKQMVVNLLSNAVKFTPEGGKIGLEVRGILEENKVTISVWDNGIGIRETDLPQLFQPFVQLDSGLAREATGTGLGLALVGQMARLHGGSVEAISQPGIGSRFTILLPWEPALATDTATRLRNTGKFRAINPDDTNKPTILLIEDTREVIMMIADYLELSGYKIVTAQDGVEGVAQARLTHPDLILMDVQMPRMDGLEATRKLRSEPEFKDTPIIALTALAMSSDRERCLAAGMNEYMSKPVNLKALSKMIRRFLSPNEETSAS